MRPGFWDNIKPLAMSGECDLWAVLFNNEDGSYNISGVVFPSWKRFRVWIYESNCMISGETDDVVLQVKRIMSKFNIESGSQYAKE